MAQKIVEIADLKTGGKNDELVTYALGSCVGICMYDEGLHIGGLLHAMLPDAYAGSMEHMDGRRDTCPERYVNTGIERLYKTLCVRGADSGNLKVKIIGGANMFSFDFSDKNMDIGTQNVIQSKRILSEMGIPVVAQMTGGTVGRTIKFYPGDARVEISATDGTKHII